MKRLAIANRGEIAIRIAQSASDMGLETIGLYTGDDAGSLHVRRLDEAVQLPGMGARGYLDIAGVVDTAQQAGADAVHPGYGFLSENAAFADAVTAAGMVFVGPSAETLRLFGDKSAAIGIAKKAGVPVLGDGTAVTLSDARAFLKSQKGAPAMLKAVSGGGGRGVRIVREGERA